MDALSRILHAETLCPDCGELHPCQIVEEGYRLLPKHRAPCGRWCAGGEEPARGEHYRGHCRRRT